MAEVADESGLTKPTAHRLLGELLHAGFLEQAPDRRYQLGPEAYAVGAAAEARYGIQQQTLAAAARLAGASEDVAVVTVRRRLHYVCIHREEGRWPVRSHVLQLGDRLPLGVGSPGLAFLAAMSPDDAEEIVAANADEVSRTFPHLPPDRVLGMIDESRARSGIGLNRGLVGDDSAGMSVAVPAANGGPGVLSIGIVAPASRMEPDREPLLTSLLLREVEHLAGRGRVRRSGRADG
ncbi:DNA-binding IclR family transcriptional regulator [Pseudonocardia parietis]|uniref:DNA-binding IclR family transcriptional regulator n=1 Tax=Pseudonocardia parietis TaxID=570936 RepID=A0ABS4W816_9PSEU|nr:DNA-binding IclR family transcriptional regulator [Pseudonocardia parietis]